MKDMRRVLLKRNYVTSGTHISSVCFFGSWQFVITMEKNIIYTGNKFSRDNGAFLDGIIG